MHKVGALIGGSVAGPAGVAVGMTIGALIMGLGYVLESTESNRQHAQIIANYQAEIKRYDFIIRRLNVIHDRFDAQEPIHIRRIHQLERMIERLSNECSFYGRENRDLKLGIREVKRDIRRWYRQFENRNNEQYGYSYGGSFGG